MVAAENNRESTGTKHMGDPFRNLIKGFFVIGRNRKDIPHITKGNLLPQINAHLKVVGGIESRDPPNPLGAKASAGAIGGARVVGDAKDGHVIFTNLADIFEIRGL